MYEIVAYRPEHKAGIAALQRHLWRGTVRQNAAYLEWKYERNPYFDAPRIYLASHAGRIVGMRGMFGSCWEIGPRGERFLAPCADDFVIAPEHRNRGLFGRIMAAAIEDLARAGHRCALSLSAGPTTLTGSLAGGWRSVASVLEVERPGRPGALHDRLGDRLASLPFVWRWAGAVSRRLAPPPFRRLDRAGPDMAREGIRLAREARVAPMAELVDRLGHDGRARHVRDEAYLRWRFGNPLYEYRFLYAGRDRLTGYLVLQASRVDRTRAVTLVDWEAETPDVRAALLRAALPGLGDPALDAWTIGAPEATRALLHEAGFVPVRRSRVARQGFHVLVRALGGAADAGGPALAGRGLLDPATWDMRMLYSLAG